MRKETGWIIGITLAFPVLIVLLAIFYNVQHPLTKEQRYKQWKAGPDTVIKCVEVRPGQNNIDEEALFLSGGIGYSYKVSSKKYLSTTKTFLSSPHVMYEVILVKNNFIEERE